MTSLNCFRADSRSNRRWPLESELLPPTLFLGALLAFASGAPAQSQGPWADFNGDGLLDLVESDPSSGLRLLLNRGDGDFDDITRLAGLPVMPCVRSATHADYDADGALDLLVCCEDGSPRLFRNVGRGQFEDVTSSSGVLVTGSFDSATWLDYDRDGNLDLHLNGQRQSILLRATAAGTFTPVRNASRMKVELDDTRPVGASDTGSVQFDRRRGPLDDADSAPKVGENDDSHAALGTRAQLPHYDAGSRTPQPLVREQPQQFVTSGATGSGWTSIPTASLGSHTSYYLRRVSLWSDLQNIAGHAYENIFVEEHGRRGLVTFVPTGDPLEPWAAGADIAGLSQSAPGGKWIHLWNGPVDFGRLGTTFGNGNIDERDAFNALLPWFDEIHVPEGTYDGHLNLDIDRPVTIHGAGPGKTVFSGGDNNSGVGSEFNLRSSLTIKDVEFDELRNVRLVNALMDPNLGTLKLENVHFTLDAADDPHGAINTNSAPFIGTENFRLEMDNCYFSVPNEWIHVSVRVGLRGHIHGCTFEHGRVGIYGILGSAGSYPAKLGNDHSIGVRISECEFLNFNYADEELDSYHIQAVGRGWVIRDCYFGDLDSPDNSGCIYSRFLDSLIVGCLFETGGVTQLFFKGSERTANMPDPYKGNGWGNTVLGCTFTGGLPGPTRGAQIFMNVKEQRIISCSFRDYDNYAIWANNASKNSDHLLVDACEFSSPISASAIYLTSGGRSIRIRNSSFTDTRGTSATSALGVIVLDPTYNLHQTNELDFRDMLVEGCVFQNNEFDAIYFSGGSENYDVDGLRFIGNTIDRGDPSNLSGAFRAEPTATITDLVLEDNYIDVHPTRMWQGMPVGCVARSRDNTWVSAPIPTSSEAVGGATPGTALLSQTGLTAGSPMILVPKSASLVRVGGADPSVTATIQSGSVAGQRVILVGATATHEVTLNSGGNTLLGASSRVLAAGDVLQLIWVQDGSGSWIEGSYSDN